MMVCAECRCRWSAVVVVALVLSAGCKSEEEKRREEAAKHMQVAAEKMQEAARQGAAAAAQGAAAAQQGGEAAQQGAAAAQQGIAAGVQGAAAGLQAAAAAMEAMAKPGAAGGTYQTVDFRQLKALLPESVGSMKRREASGEKNAVMGFAVSEAKASYRPESGEGRIRIKLLDIGTSAGPLAMATIGWGMVEIDKESEDGYERTTKIDGRKALEKYDSKRKNGEIKVVAGGRFVVEIDGDDVSMDDMKSALGKIDLAKLEGLKPAPAAAK